MYAPANKAIIGSDYGSQPVGTKPLPEQMLV